MATDDEKMQLLRVRIGRLRTRLGDKPAASGAEEVIRLRNVLKGILDLLADEL